MSHVSTHAVPEYLVAREEARNRDRTIQWLAAALAVVFISAAAALLPAIDGMRREYQLTLDPESTKGLPPDMALLTKTGTLRALVIDFAFIRLEQLKQENKWHELDKLSTLVCKLAPRFPSVWSYSAWNQAYNISVAQYTAEGRWYWVRNGIDLLRKQGIPYNEKSIGLYRELVWIFWHKVGDFLDDHHWNYKKYLAIEVERVLGAPLTTSEPQSIIDSFKEIAQAPDGVAALLSNDAAAAAYARDLQAQGLSLDDSLLEFVARYVRHQIQIEELFVDVREDDILTLHQRRVALLSDRERSGARERLLACLRKAALREQFNMDPAWMLGLMEKYGPLDWRSPYMHALYWATRGNEITKGQLDLDEDLSMQMVRLIPFSLDHTVKRGKITLEPNFDDPLKSYLELAPDSRFVRPLHEAYLTLGAEQFGKDPRFIPGTAGPNYMQGHFSFLSDSIRLLYTEGGQKNMELAQELYAYLRKYNLNDDRTPKEQYFLPLRQFVLADFKSDLAGFKTANMTIGAWIGRSLKQLSLEEVDASVASLDIARWGWEYYQQQKGIDPQLTNRRSLAPLINIRADAVVEFMTSADIAVIHKVRLWRALDEITRQMTYDQILPHLTSLCAAHEPPLLLDRVLQQPPDMEGYRLRAPRKDSPDESVSPGEKSW
ncbi:MAG: hypothetical protein HOP29_20030 [Phycisphaerales bacterium]|nr:hypothetical protein [Phycisphaerales bacterium]